MKNLHPLLLSFLSGLLLFAAWPMSPFTSLVFFAFVPLLWLERQGIRRKKFFGWVYLSMFIWNVSTTWWVWNASPSGAIGAFLANSLLMCLPWLGFHYIKNRMGETIGYLSLVVLWMSFEYLHLQDWGLSWPWLTLGNIFATHPGWVQWYEFTGASGGTGWILVVNILLFRLLWERYKRGVYTGRRTAWFLVALFIPFALSYFVLVGLHQNATTSSAAAMSPTAGENDKNIVIVQPNIDPYEKIFTGSFEAQLQKLIRLSDSSIDNNTSLVVWPETALYMENGIDEDHMKENYFLRPLWDFLRRHPNINLLTGVESYRLFRDSHGGTARQLPSGNQYAEDYNAAVLLDSSGPAAFYHKSMLVPGVETLPSFLHFMAPVFEKFGGTTSGYTRQKDRTPLTSTNNSYRIAVAVCYESIYGEFMSRYVRNGADLIAVITNDGWWGNTPGYHQHENYARLRAIETRRWLVRSANTGISCVIDPEGRIIDPRPWDLAATIRYPAPAPEDRLTFYTRYGDWLSKAAVALTILFLGWNIITIIKTRSSRG